ncbi:uncharacterized protein LOC143279819 isoform X2 [Babylonia areolata]|uniref:uncharacterized protein LOC143279819 isoform X2 n=1 Tax=Babylonia areolata TaxID=304850 RepID=UPI003FD0C6BD
MATSLLVGMEDRDSAKRRRQEEYRQDLELQIREREAAKQRERLQDMLVDASGWLDPEKRPERLKPLGGANWTEQRGRRNDRVRPYHSLFTYDREFNESPSVVRRGGDSGDFLVSERQAAPVKTPPGLKYQPLTYAGAGVPPPDHSYAMMGARDNRNGGGGPLVQPITLPYPDNRPIIIHGGGGGDVPQTTRTVVEYRDDSTARELRNFLGLVQSENDKLRRDNDDFHRRLLRELEEEKRRMHDQEEDARRRVEKIRREAEENRKEAERQRLEAERLRREAATRPKSAQPPNPNTKPYYDTDEYRRRMMEERKRIEELLKADDKPKTKDVLDIQVVRKQPRFHLNLPPTPPDDDTANRDNVRDFNDLKHRDFGKRDEFRRIYPDVPLTNRRLEEQQEALLRYQQGASVPDMGSQTDRPAEKPKRQEEEPRRAVSRPGWLDHPPPTPLENTKWDQKNRAEASKPEKNSKSRDKLHLRNLRPKSSETLADDTWIQPSDIDMV